MAERLEVYRCDLCGNVVEVMHGGVGALGCCGKPVVHLAENTVDAAKEKHVPVVERIPGGVKVMVGSVEHPMLEKHYIEWIEVVADNRVYRKDLKPGEKPEATFMIDAETVVVREYCNIHGVWKAEG